MALNKFMHSRNPYKEKRPNFKQLAAKYEEFKEHVTVDDKGGVHIDFKKPECLRALSWVLLMDDFGLDVLMPLDRLIPTIPLRVNYILWLEDILVGCDGPISGIDIGTGASCVYAMLGVKMNNWRFLATETDPTNFTYAKKNVEKNNLTDNITVSQVMEGSSLFDVLTDNDTTYTFCMCNPPFFGSNFEAWGMLTSRSDKRPEPSSVSTASPVECIVPGGEIEFTKRMISDSLQLKDRIRVYTTMLGKKSSLPVLKEELRRNGVHNVGQTEFCQGKTMRWGLGWSFDTNIKFPIPPTKANKAPKAKIPLILHLPKEYSLEEATNKIFGLLKELEIAIRQTHESEKRRNFTITATKNTWSNQRRKRRQQNRVKSDSTNIDPEDKVMQERQQDSGEGSDTCCRRIVQDPIDQSQFTTVPRDQNEVDNDLVKKQKLDTENKVGNIHVQESCINNSSNQAKCSNSNTTNISDGTITEQNSKNSTESVEHVPGHVADPDSVTDDESVLLMSAVCLSKKESDVTLEMTWMAGERRDAMHQILQYIKNKLN